MRRVLSLVALVVLSTTLLTACGSGIRKSAPAPQRQPATPDGAPSPAVGRGSPESGSLLDGGGTAASAPVQPGAGQAVPGAWPAPVPLEAAATSVPTPADARRKIVLNAQFDVKVKDADEAVNRIGISVRAAGGYVQETKVSGTRQQGRSVNMSLRVPAAQYGNIVDLIIGLGEVTGRREWTEDVTEQYVDLEERIRSKEAHLTRLRQLLNRSGSVKELMEVEQEIDRVTAELESLQGRVRLLANRVDFSTIVLNLYEPQMPAPIEEPGSIWERMKLAFKASASSLANFTGNVAVVLASALPVVAYVTTLVAPAYAVFRAIRGAWRRRAAPVPPLHPAAGVTGRCRKSTPGARRGCVATANASPSRSPVCALVGVQGVEPWTSRL
ncbi:DUF4349 domain-containing protein [Caldinitratiruptor microaerophilus]|uniref:DUF4349 domain-containing protein n=1 Tax=Caldinitratiruptor microaerophilus TaxID=671077 RepID=A0AA35CM16_9FIRM|nr:hypothetical protein caldi_19680 [Caldinitratiruptor microaerophilus]